MASNIDNAQNTLTQLQSLALNDQHPLEVRSEARSRAEGLERIIKSGGDVARITDQVEIWLSSVIAAVKRVVNGPETGRTKHDSMMKDPGLTAALTPAAMAQKLGGNKAVSGVDPAKISDLDIDRLVEKALQDGREPLSRDLVLCHRLFAQDMRRKNRHSEYDKAVQSLSDAELISITFYMQLFWFADAVNSKLRGKPVEPFCKPLVESATFEAIIRAATNGLMRLPSYSGVVYRAVHQLDPSPYRPGAVVTDPAFVSTSMDPDKVAKMAWQPGDTVFVIQSKTGRRVDFLTGIADEHEVLFPPGCRFQVLKRAEQNGQEHIFLKEV